MVKLSKEQERFIDEAKKGENILVDACIGSGKTTAIQMLCKELPEDKRILYLTYNTLLKIDAKSKIRGKNRRVTNYHGFAYWRLHTIGIIPGNSDSIQIFLKERPPIDKYDVLIIDEYQDIDLEISKLLDYIKEVNQDIQVIAVGDMKQKIYDRTKLNVNAYINELLGDHIELEFTQCFRLSEELAAKLGRIWEKKIVGVNSECEILHMDKKEVVEFLATQNPKDVLCLGSHKGIMSKVLNILEDEYPDKYNKKTVYATISDDDSIARVKPTSKAAVFTTFDKSKGLERKIVVISDFTEEYWEIRSGKPQQSYEILRNIFCVAASRGKGKIIFVKTDEEFLSEKTLSTPYETNINFRNMNISKMFDFKFKEDIEESFSLLDIKEIKTEKSLIKVKANDELIDLSPCIGIYQEAVYFEDYDIDRAIKFSLSIDDDWNYLYEKFKGASLEKKILLLAALETKQKRYIEQVDTPIVNDCDKEKIISRLSEMLKRDENIQAECILHFSDEDGGKILFQALGMADVIKNNIVYELKFVSELQHKHFLQCASYMVALNLEKGILWNVRDNSMFEIRIPNKKEFMDAVTNTITKNYIGCYRRPSEEEILKFEEWINQFQNGINQKEV